MNIDDCYLLGEIVKTHGLKGYVIALLDVDDPKAYQDLQFVFLHNKSNLIPFVIKDIQIDNKKTFIKFEDIESIETAHTLIGSQLFLPLDSLPSLPEGKYYFHDLIGCNVFHDGDIIGKVIQIIDLPNNEIMVVKYKSKDLLIPIKDEIIQKVDLEKKTIFTSLPNGLLELYLS